MLGRSRIKRVGQGQTPDYAATLPFAPRSGAGGCCDGEPPGNRPGTGAAAGGRRNARSTVGAVIPHACGPHSAACTVATDQVRFDFPLPRTARLLASGLPIKIVALGSSSTRGAGA